MNKELSPELLKQIEQEADKFAFQVPYNGTNEFYNKDLLKGYIAGATEYAQKAKIIFDQILSEEPNFYKEITIGPELINEIKQFLDGNQ